MSIQLLDRLNNEIIPSIKESVVKGIASTAFHDVVAFPNSSAVPESLESEYQVLTDHLPEGGMAYKSFGSLAQRYVEIGDTAARFDPKIDEIAHGVSIDFDKWESEMNGISPSPLLVINRNDAAGAIALWQAHQSENTESAARHILHYASVATPKARQQEWSEAYAAAFELMVKASRNNQEDKLTLSTALRQTKIARHSLKDQETFSYIVEDYDDIFSNND